MADDPLDELMEDGLSTGLDDGVDGGLSELFGGNLDALASLAAVVREKVLTGLESLTGNRPLLSDVSFGVADRMGLETEFNAVAHAGVDVAITLPEGEQFGGALLVPLGDLGGLLSIETAPESMADAAFAEAQMALVSAAAREFFDLMSMTLFVDHLQGIEAVPGDARVGDPATTLARVEEMAGGARLLRIDVGLALAGDEAVRLVVVVPQAFLDAIGIAAGGDGAGEPARAPMAFPTLGVEPPAAAAGRESREAAAPTAEDEPDGLFGLDEDLSKISPLRPAGTFGAGAREDVDVHPVRFPPLSEPSFSSERRALDLIMDVSMRVTVELGRSTLTVEEVLSLGPGSVVELNKLAGEPVDVLVNEQLIARGEVVVVDENFGVRVTEIVSPRKRAQAMGA